MALSLATGALLSVLLTACSGQPYQPLDQRCSEGLRTAYAELETAKASGFGGTVAWAKAASLLSAARVQEQFEKYPNCIDKVRRARYYIRRI